MSTNTQLTNYIAGNESQKCWSNCFLVSLCRSNSAAIYGILNSLYDVITGLLSVVDLVTDVLVMIEYYNKGYMIFFTISLIVILFAQISYSIAFLLRTWDRYADCWDHSIVFAASLIFAPILSFVMYFMAKYEWCRDTIESCCLNAINFEEPESKQHVTELQAWMQEKIYKHIGFILEAACEAFPQSILQMIAIVYYEETSLLPIVSILISLLSVASKSFVFSVSAGINIQTIVFYWLCAVTDFFGIFFIVSWVFYVPNSDDTDDNNVNQHDIINVHIISQIWFYKVLIVVIPLATLITSILIGILLSEANDNRYCILLMSAFGLPFGIIFLSIGLEVSTFIFIAFIINKYYTSRFPTNNENFIAWNELIDWIYDNQGYDIQDLIDDMEKMNSNSNIDSDNGYQVQRPYECSGSQDRIIRICCINYCYFKRGLNAFDSDLVLSSSIGNAIDFKTRYEANERNNKNKSSSKYRTTEELKPGDDIMLRNYLSKPENLNKCFVDINYNDIKQNTNKYHRKSKRKRTRKYNAHDSIIYRFYSGYVSFWDEIKDVIPNRTIEIFLEIVVYILAPLYLISRIVGLMFPIIIILYVNGYGLWNDIDGLQWSLLGIYTCLFLAVIILCLFIVPRAYYQSFILPGADIFPTLIPGSKLFVNFVKDYYYPKLIITPIRDYLIKDIFGVDVGRIILKYLGDLNVDDGKTVLNFTQFKEAMGNV